MKEKKLLEIPYNEFGLEAQDISLINSRTMVVTKWNWNYSDAHRFQRFALSFIQDHFDGKILIFCNHPPTLTNGRGLQRPRKGEILDLVPFSSQDHPNLPYPFFQIERGGGLTFHHPGQFIFYPIVKLNPKTLSLSQMVKEIFDFSIEILHAWGLRDLTHERQLLGLWYGEKKIASMGIAIEKLVTFHGMALNIYRNAEMMNSLEGLNPCGLNLTTYTAVEDLVSLPSDFLEIFKNEFLKRIEREWK